MTNDEMKELREGDIVRHRGDRESLIVMANFGKRVTAARIVDITNPDEWEVVRTKRKGQSTE